MIPNDFSDYYKTLSDTGLLDILEHQENYQLLAVEAAKKEFENRHLSKEEISKAREPLIRKQLEKEQRKNKVKAIETRVRSASNMLVDTLNPVQTETPTTDKLIRFISIAFFALFLLKLITDLKMLSGMVKYISRFDSSSFFYFLPFVVLPTASIAFWARKTFGWMLLAFYLIYSAIGAIWILLDSFSWQPTGTSFDKLFPRPLPIVYIIQIGILAVTFYIISKQNIRTIFKINKPRLIATIIMCSLVTIFLMLEF